MEPSTPRWGVGDTGAGGWSLRHGRLLRSVPPLLQSGCRSCLLLAKDTQGAFKPELLTCGCYLFPISDFCSGQTSCGDRTFIFLQTSALKGAGISFHLSVSRVKEPLPCHPTFQCLIPFELQGAGRNCGARPREVANGKIPTAEGSGRHLGAERHPHPCPSPPDQP